MSPRSQPAPDLSPVEAAAECLKNFDWNLPPFVATEDLEDECTRYLQGLADERCGRSLSEFEETYERSRWFRSQAMMRHLDQFTKLVELCFNFVNELTKVGRQSHLGSRAGLQKANTPERPSSGIEFKPAPFPDKPPLSCSEYESLVGGPHVFGARILWWCAAAKSPEEFGYSPGHFQKIWTQPFWYLESGARELRINGRPIALLQRAAIVSSITAALLEKPELNRTDTVVLPVSPSGFPVPKDGPGPDGRFYWNGNPIELQPIQMRLMAFLWKKPTNRVSVEDAVDEVWGGKPLKDDSYSGCVSKLNTRFLVAGVPIVVYFRQAHFSYETHRKE